MEKDEIDGLFDQMKNLKNIEAFHRQQMEGKNKAADMRDDIAIRVLIAMIETTPHAEQQAESVDGLARTAYRFADAMMAAREGKATAEDWAYKGEIVYRGKPLDPSSLKEPSFDPGMGAIVYHVDTGRLGVITGQASTLNGSIPVKWEFTESSIYERREKICVCQRPLLKGDRVKSGGEEGVVVDVDVGKGLATVAWSTRVPTIEWIIKLEIVK